MFRAAKGDVLDSEAPTKRARNVRLALLLGAALAHGLSGCASGGGGRMPNGDGGGVLDGGDRQRPDARAAMDAGNGRCEQPLNCLDHDAECGVLPNGCGGVINCGECGAGQACGSSGERGRCGPATCVPRTCADYPDVDCGSMADGCGGLTESCGVCDEPSCTPRTCADLGIQCGFSGDGCGGVVNCGSCQAGESCGASGVHGICGSDCDPLSCADHGAQCGIVSDGCGGTVDCGQCPFGQSCGLERPHQCARAGSA